MKKIPLQFLLFLALYADDTFIGGSGYNAYPLHNEQIKMLYEVVDIEIEDWKKAFVNCEFVFENTGPKVEDVMFGFPTPSEELYELGNNPMLYDFICKVDGQQIEI
jgi:hypothetical protein